jgi:hypothetical protein
MYHVKQILNVGRNLTGEVIALPNGMGQGKYLLRIQESNLPEAHKPQWFKTEDELTKLN